MKSHRVNSIIISGKSPPLHCSSNSILLQYYVGCKYKATTCEVGATERGCSGSIGSDDTRGYGAGSGDVGKELPRGMIP